MLAWRHFGDLNFLRIWCKNMFNTWWINLVHYEPTMMIPLLVNILFCKTKQYKTPLYPQMLCYTVHGLAKCMIVCLTSSSRSVTLSNHQSQTDFFTFYLVNHSFIMSITSNFRFEVFDKLSFGWPHMAIYKFLTPTNRWHCRSVLMLTVWLAPVLL